MADREENFMKENRGILLNAPRGTDFVAGGITGITGEVLVPSGDWTPYLPDYEPQSFSNQFGQQTVSYDTLACVTFSAFNCIEALFRVKFNRIENFSDRFTAKISGTTETGNYLYKVWDSIRHDGVVREFDYRNDALTREDYYKEIPPDLVTKAKTVLSDYKIQYEFLYGGEDEIMSALEKAPLQIAIQHRGDLQANGTIKSYNDVGAHAVMLYGYEKGVYWKIYDHYDNKFKKYAWDLKFFSVLRPNLEKAMPTLPHATNTFLQLVEAPGGFGLVIDDKLIVEQRWELLASALVRNNGTLTGKVVPVKKDVWSLYKHVNLKMEPV